MEINTTCKKSYRHHFRESLASAYDEYSVDGSGTTDFLSVFFFVMVFVKKLYKFLKNPYEFLKENHMNFLKII